MIELDEREGICDLEPPGDDNTHQNDPASWLAVVGTTPINRREEGGLSMGIENLDIDDFAHIDEAYCGLRRSAVRKSGFFWNGGM